MAKVRSSTSTFFASDVLDCVVRLPEHATNDLLLMIVTKDDATGGSFTTPAGWTKGGENTVGASGANTVRAAWYYEIAASGSEVDPTISSSDADSWSAVCVSIRGVDTGTPIDISNGNGITDSTGNPYPAASVTTTTDNALVLYGIACDGGVSPVATPGFTTVAIADSGNDACALAFKVQRTAGATGTCDFYASGNADDSVLFTIAIRDGSSSAIIPGYPNSDVATIVRPLKGANLTFGTDSIDANSNNFTQLAGTWQNPDTVYQVDASPLTFTDITAAATNATDADVVPFPATEAVGDYLAIGYSSAFRALRVDRAGCTAGAGGVHAREYLATGGTWKALSEYFESANQFNGTLGDHQICGWTIPGDWSAQSLNGVSKFWIRIRLTTIYTTNPTLSQLFVSTSYALAHDTLTAQADTGVVPLFDSTLVSPAAGGNLMSGGAYVLGSVVDLSSALLVGTYLFGSPRDFVDLGFRSDGGVALGLIDSTNKVKAWTVGAADSRDTYADKRNIFAIQVGQSTDTSLLSNTPTMTDVKRLLLMANNRYGACNVAYNQLLNVGTLKVSGGGSSAPVDYDELVRVANAYPCPLIDAVTNTAYCPIQIGGDQAVNFQASGFTLTFPQQATVANKKTQFHCDNNLVGIIIDARAGDTCKITSAKITSLSPYVFNILATASASATYDFTGNVIENATVTLRDVCEFHGMSFANCPSFTQNGATIGGCQFSGTKITSDNPGEISDCAFTSAGSGHAIEATTPGTYAFNDNTFSGYGADGTTDAAFYNNSGGAITLNLNTSEAPTVRNGAGATTTVVQPSAAISVTNMPTAGAHIRLQIQNTTALSSPSWTATTAYTAGQKVKRTAGLGAEQTAGLYFVATTAGTSGGTEPTWNTTVGNTTSDGTVVWTCYAILFYDSNPGAASYSTTYINGKQVTAGDNITVRFAELNGATSFKTYENLTVAAASGFSFNVMAESDAVYAANAIDGRSTAVTNIYTADYADNEIVLDANLNFTNPKGYAFYCGELTTSLGMWKFWDGITALDVGNYRVNVDVVDIMLDESAGFVRQEDTDTSRWYRSDGSRPYKDPTTGGSGLFVNWMNPVYVQSVGSAVLPSDIVAIADEVRTELAIELADIGDIKTTTAALPTAAEIRVEIDSNSTQIAAIKAKTDNLPADPASQTQVNTRLASSSYVAPPSAATTATAVRSELTTELARIDATISSRNATAPDNAGIAAIKAKTDNLTFSAAGSVDANVKRVNGVEVAGTGAAGDEWGPA